MPMDEVISCSMQAAETAREAKTAEDEAKIAKESEMAEDARTEEDRQRGEHVDAQIEVMHMLNLY